MYPLRAFTYQFSLFSSRRKKKRQKGNKSTHYASNAVEKKWGAIYYFSFFDRSVACNHEIPGFEACVRWKRSSSLRGSLFCSSQSSVQTLHIAATIRSTKMYFLVGRSSVFPNFVFPRLFATRNRVFISRSRNESPAGFVVVNPPVCQVWNRDVVKIEKFDWIIVRSIRKIIRET